MLDFFIENTISLLFGLVSTGLIAYFGIQNGKLKKLKKLEEEEAREQVQIMINVATQEIKNELEVEKQKFNAIKESYRYRLISLCEIYLDRGFITSKEYTALSEMWKVYHALGGNSQAEDMYHRTERLPIHDK